MKFKLVYNPSQNGWYVYLKESMFSGWVPISTCLGIPQSFRAYDEVVAFIKERGIDKVYQYQKSIFHYYPPEASTLS